MKDASESAVKFQDLSDLFSQITDYWTDFWQRSILCTDVLRERSNRYYKHKARKTPHVLNFETELIQDGRTFDRPVNYGLVRVKPPEGITINHGNRPFVVIDPRAGHGPGIGGFKPDSEVGMAMLAGHPCYFIGFTPNPMPGQTIEDVLNATVLFIEKVIDLHPEAEGKPCVIGNCQAGWAIMMSAAIRPELFGPVIAAGSPVSYWAGVSGKNPMRYSGGLLGGSWLTTLTSDLGNGKFDGAYLVGNFENLNPANTLWTKNYNLWSQVDTEANRFLDFETWWGGHINLNAEEIQWIVDQLFIGNRLATAEITTQDGIRVDLSNISSPIVCLCSEGDNITPPQQALGWIIDLYENDDALLANNQTIVYAIHKSIGHLGIFVSSSVARKEHEEFATNIDLIDTLPPGLYEAIMIPKEAESDGKNLVVGEWITHFEPRTLADLRTIVQPKAEDEIQFATVRRISEINRGLYRLFWQSTVKGLANEQTADWLRQLNPSTLPFELFSDYNPFMQYFAQLADHVRKDRHPVSTDNPLLKNQVIMSDVMIALLDGWRDFRDKNAEQIFRLTYGSPLLQAMVGLKASDQNPRRRPGTEPEKLEFIKARIADLKEHLTDGGPKEAFIRSLIYIGMVGHGADERNFEALRMLRDSNDKTSLEDFKRLVRKQFFALKLDRDAAMAAIPSMLSTSPDVAIKLLNQIKLVTMAAGKPTDEQIKRLKKVGKLFGDACQKS